MKEQFTKEHCKLAIDACQRLSPLPQHPNVGRIQAWHGALVAGETEGFGSSD